MSLNLFVKKFGKSTYGLSLQILSDPSAIHEPSEMCTAILVWLCSSDDSSAQLVFGKHGFEFRRGLNIFQASFLQVLNLQLRCEMIISCSYTTIIINKMFERLLRRF